MNAAVHRNPRRAVSYPRDDGVGFGGGVHSDDVDDGHLEDSLSACLLITCDQVVTYDGAIREKPTDAAEARRFITSYGEKPVSTVGAVAVTDLVTGERFGPLVDRATVRFDPIPTHVVDFLIDEGTCLHCAGGLMVEHPKMVALAGETKGSADALMGLSKATVGRLLLEALEKRVQKQ